MENLLLPINITVRQSVFFLITKLLFLNLLFLLIYALFDLSILFLADTNPNIGLILQADWMGVITLFIASSVEMVMVIIIVLKWVTEIYEIQEDKIIHKRGVLRVKEDVHSFRNFTAVSITKNLTGRIINYGTIKLYNPAINHTLLMPRIQSPEQIKSFLTERLSSLNENPIIRNPTLFRK